MDASKLTPAPWEFVPGTNDDVDFAFDGAECLILQDNDDDGRKYPKHLGFFFTEAANDLAFIVLARNFLAVQSRRGWSLDYNSTGWEIAEPSVPERFRGPWGTVLESWQAAVDADRWLEEQAHD